MPIADAALLLLLCHTSNIAAGEWRRGHIYTALPWLHLTTDALPRDTTALISLILAGERTGLGVRLRSSEGASPSIGIETFNVGV
jgi:hypothetical protein